RRPGLAGTCGRHRTRRRRARRPGHRRPPPPTPGRGGPTVTSTTPIDRAPAPRWFLQALVYAALTSSIVSSLGMLLVPSVAAEFDITVSTAQWMLTVNLLVGAVATPIMGRLADGPHTRRLLLSSLRVIFVGSIIATLAPNFTVFLLGRALQGLLYGTVPISIALARRHLSYVASQPAISTLSVTVSIGMGLGYPLTGVLAALFDHRAAFAFAALFVVTAAVGVWRFVPGGPDPLAPRTPFDLPGAATLGLGLALRPDTGHAHGGRGLAPGVGHPRGTPSAPADQPARGASPRGPAGQRHRDRPGHRDVHRTFHREPGLPGPGGDRLRPGGPAHVGRIPHGAAVGGQPRGQPDRPRTLRPSRHGGLPPDRRRGDDHRLGAAVAGPRLGLDAGRGDVPVRRRHRHRLRGHARAHRPQCGGGPARQRGQLQPGPPHGRRGDRRRAVRRRTGRAPVRRLVLHRR